MKPRLEYFPKANELMQAVLALNKAVEESGLERSLLHLLKLRASQINRCSYCVDMHAREAREEGRVSSAFTSSPPGRNRRCSRTVSAPPSRGSRRSH